MTQFILTNIHIVSLDETQEDGYGWVRDGAIAIQGDQIAWVGEQKALPMAFRELPVIDGQQTMVTPGLIDCHTHSIYAGNRSNEFEQRLNGVSYEEIARQGGGIISTVKATRRCDEQTLFELALGRVETMQAQGVTTLEVKSGYGLDTETELKMLRVARRLGQAFPVDIRTTFLGAHAIPAEYRTDRQAYLDLVCDEMLPSAVSEQLVDAVDGFCEQIAFSRDEIEQVFKRAAELGVPVKLHAEQLSDLKGAELAAQYHALSCDHLEYLDQQGVDAMAESGSVAVLLPGAFYFLHETRKPPVEQLRSAGVPIAVATDLNPGSSPVFSLLTAMNMGCVLFGLTPLEALKGSTVYAARALGLSDRGTVRAGQLADLAVWDVESPAELLSSLGHQPCRAVFKSGECVYGQI